MGTHAQVQTRDRLAGKQLCQEGYGVPVDNDFTKSQECTLVAEEASSVLGCIRKNIVSRRKEVILPPLLMVKTTAGQLHPVPRLCRTRDMDILQHV